ncbi:MAG TPA: NUDIX hydrolase [Polyangiaceae bacterium]|jgi:8-oxo-dGTP pyrophosphatase MutT (NUDIX family)|nr:NUDIX hydrolase [Polyangiaceae bacterium]
MSHRPLIPWHVLSRTLLLERTYLRVREDRVRLGDGREIDDFCVVESPDWAAVLCLTDDERVPLVRQYRHGIGKVSWELPAGALEPGEEPLAGARRELLEETGFVATSWEPLLLASVDPARQASCAHFYFARGGHAAGAPTLDATEELETVLVGKAELLAMIDRGELLHGVHIAAILAAARRGLL